MIDERADELPVDGRTYLREINHPITTPMAIPTATDPTMFPPDADPGAWLYRQRTLPPHHRPVSQGAAFLPNHLQLHPQLQTSGAMPYALFRRSVRRPCPPLFLTLCLSS